MTLYSRLKRNNECISIVVDFETCHLVFNQRLWPLQGPYARGFHFPKWLKKGQLFHTLTL